MALIFMDGFPPVVAPGEIALDGDSLGLLTWIEWSHVDASGTPQTLVFSKIPLSDSGDANPDLLARVEIPGARTAYWDQMNGD